MVDELSEGLRKVSLQDVGAEASAEKENTKAASADEEPQSFSTSLLPLGVPDIDADVESNHLNATMYAKDIFEYLASLEVSAEDGEAIFFYSGTVCCLVPTKPRSVDRAA